MVFGFLAFSNIEPPAFPEIPPLPDGLGVMGDFDVELTERVGPLEPPKAKQKQNTTTYEPTVYDKGYICIEMDEGAVKDLTKLNYNTILDHKRFIDDWAQGSSYPNLAKWFTETFKPQFDLLLESNPRGLFIKASEFAPYDDGVKGIFKEKAERNTALIAERDYPHLIPLDQITRAFIFEREMHKLMVLTSAERAIEFLARSPKICSALVIFEENNLPFSIFLKPYDFSITPSLVKRMAVLVDDDCAEGLDGAVVQANDPKGSKGLLDNREPKVMAVTSFENPYDFDEIPRLPSTDFFPQECLRRAQKFVREHREKLFPSETIPRAIIDFPLKFDPMHIAFNGNLERLHLPNIVISIILDYTQELTSLFFNRIPYIPMPTNTVFSSIVGKQYTKDLVSTVLDNANKALMEETVKTLQDDNIADEAIVPIIAKMSNTERVNDIMSEFLPPKTSAQTFYFRPFEDRHILFMKSSTSEARVDLYDYWAAYASSCWDPYSDESWNNRRRTSTIILKPIPSHVYPITFQQFKDIYLSVGHANSTEEETFLGLIMEAEKENDKERDKIFEERAKKLSEQWKKRVQSKGLNIHFKNS